MSSELMDFLERFSINGQYYFVLNNPNKDEADWEIYCCITERKNESNKWSIRQRCKPYRPPTLFMSNKDILKVIRSRNLDLDSFNTQLSSSVISLIGYTSMVQKRATETFGAAFVDNAIKGTEEFGKALSKAVSNAIKKSNIKIVK